MSLNTITARLLLCLVCWSFVHPDFSQAQIPQAHWVRQVTTQYGGTANGITADSAGNCYVTGSFTGQSDFGGTNLTSVGSDAFVAKYSRSGELLWVRTASSEYSDAGQGVAVDALGNFLGSSSTGDFVASCDPLSGWATGLVRMDSTNGWNRAAALQIDAQTNVLVVGTFSLSARFPGTNLVAPGFALNSYIAQFSSAGAPRWIKHFAGTNENKITDVAVHASGNVYICGYCPRNSDLRPCCADEPRRLRPDRRQTRPARGGPMDQTSRRLVCTGRLACS